jgi:release factor glutamine methyltransferase
MTLRDHVGAARERLKAAGVADAEAALDAELLARDVLGWDRARFLVRAVDQPPPGFIEAFERHLERRARREPVAYILGRQAFWGRDFAVSPAVLIPRPETEAIVEEVLATVSRARGLRVLDVGTGSGCLAITLAMELGRPARVDPGKVHPGGTRHPGTLAPGFPGAAVSVVATDVSAEALVIARLNAHALLGPDWADLVEFRYGSGAAGANGPFDLIVANPPYVTAREHTTLEPEVRVYEPRVALVGGDDGLRDVRSTIAEAPARLAHGGRLLLEIGYDQAGAVEAVVADTEGVSLLRIRPDLRGIPRIAIIERDREDTRLTFSE